MLVRMMLLLCWSFELFSSQNSPSVVEVVSYSKNLISQDHVVKLFPSICSKYSVSFHYSLYDYVRQFKKDSPSIKKILFFDYCEDIKTFRLPKKKMVCFKWEAIKIRPWFYEPYSRVYTFDDDLVDGKKFRKFCYPVLKPMTAKIVPFEDKHLCTMIVGNWIPERIRIVEFFKTKTPGVFEFYGRYVPDQSWLSHPMYRGKIEGDSSSSDKMETMGRYRFCFCFENTHTVRGYITEKIFDAFSAGCVPIYWGPENVESYIPKTCFIDYKQFEDLETLYQYLKTMTKETYELYLSNIRQFLASDQARLFSTEYFDRLVLEAVNDDA